MTFTSHEIFLKSERNIFIYATKVLNIFEFFTHFFKKTQNYLKIIFQYFIYYCFSGRYFQ
jgi:hypothetical protein